MAKESYKQKAGCQKYHFALQDTHDNNGPESWHKR